MKNYYKILGLAEDCTQDEIKEKWSELRKQWHPDKFPDDQKAEAQKKFQKYNEAYQTLKNKERRKFYDAELRAHRLEQELHRQAEESEKRERKFKEERARWEKQQRESQWVAGIGAAAGVALLFGIIILAASGGK